MSGKDWSEDLEGKSAAETALNVRWFLIVLELPGIYDTKNMLLLSRVLDKTLNIKRDTAELVIKWVNEYSKERFQKLVLNLKGILAELVCPFLACGTKKWFTKKKICEIR